MKRIGLRETDEQALAKAKQRAQRANRALAIGSDDPEEFQKLNAAAQKAAYELEVLEKKAREKKSQADKKLADEAKDRRDKDQQLQLDAFDRVKQEEDRIADAKKKLAEDAARDAEKESEKKKKLIEQEMERVNELADLRYERAWQFASDEQKLAQVIKEGREAQARVDADASSANLIAIEKVRKKYIELLETIRGKKDGSSTGGDSGDGSRMSRGVKVSAEDAARTDATYARNARLNSEAMRGRIRESRQVGSVEKGNKTDELLQQIRDSLKPKAVK